MPASELVCLTAWSQLGHKGHRIVFLEVKGKVRQLAARSKRDGLGWVPVFLNGSGPVGVLIRQQPRQQRERAISRQAFLEVALAEARVAGLPDADYTVATPEELKEKELPYLLELLQATYAVYKNTWNGLYKEPSPLFLRAVFRKVFRPLALTLIEDAGKPSELCRHLPVGFAPAYLVSLIGRLPMERRLDAAEYINKELADRIESEVLKLEAAEPSRSKEEPAAEPEQARGSPQSSGAGAATWDTIEISFLSDERIQIYNGTDTKPYNYAEFGFADSRNGKPNQAWVTLRDLAEAKGIILINARRVSPWPKVEKRIQEIRKALRDHFGITSDPFLFKDGIGYQARFKIGVSPSFHT